MKERLAQEVLEHMASVGSRRPILSGDEIAGHFDHEEPHGGMDETLTEAMQYLVDQGKVLRRYRALSPTGVALDPFYLSSEHIPEILVDRFERTFHRLDAVIEEVFVRPEDYDPDKDYTLVRG